MGNFILQAEALPLENTVVLFDKIFPLSVLFHCSHYYVNVVCPIFIFWFLCLIFYTVYLLDFLFYFLIDSLTLFEKHSILLSFCWKTFYLFYTKIFFSIQQYLCFSKAPFSVGLVCVFKTEDFPPNI